MLETETIAQTCHSQANMSWELIFLVLGLFITFIILLIPLTAPKVERVKGEHVIVTGGSSGIGKAVAIDLAKRGANVTLVARNKQKLEEAKAEVEKHLVDRSNQKVQTLSLDLSTDYEAVEHGLKTAESTLGPVFMLVNSAGLAINARFLETAIGDFKRSMDINYLGSVYASRAVLKGMIARNQGRIVFVSSIAGQVGIYGYTAYSGSKFALRGLAEALQMEVKPYNIRITLSFPPDTDTPGFAEELKTKPLETKLISETAVLFEADRVAKCMIDDALRGKFLTYLGLDGWLSTHVSAGVAPPGSILDILLQFFLMGLLRVIAIAYLKYFDSIVNKCKRKREAEEREELEERKEE